MKFSVITPVYNRADCIERCLQSVICQSNTTDVTFEHIVVDDGSVDNTTDIIQLYADRSNNINFIHFSNNHGTNAARNAAILAAKGEWCIFLDSDDYFVDNAIALVDKTMYDNQDYKHYMFAADDRQAYYMENTIIHGQKQCELHYSTFLSEKVDGDFVHVCKTETLRKNLFDENLRIYEGLTFLMFYRDAEDMLFTNIVITIRERNRIDSATKELFRTNLTTIRRKISFHSQILDSFEDDMFTMGLIDIINKHKIALYDNLLLDCNYISANKIYQDLTNNTSLMKVRALRVIQLLHLGCIYRLFLRWFLIFKYSILKKRIQ